MSADLSPYITIAISSRALFDLEKENKIFETRGLKAYERWQVEHEGEILAAGPGFPLVRAILKLNSKIPAGRKAEVVIMSRNNASVALRIMESVEHYKLDITRAAFTSGTPLSRYMDSFAVTLFLSRNPDDVRETLANHVAAGLLYASPPDFGETLDEIRIAFDGDAVIFSNESEMIYQKKGLKAFLKHEKKNADKPLPEGPFAKLLKALSFLQQHSQSADIPIRLAVVTARNSPAHERVLKTLRAWNVRVHEVFFMGGYAKENVLKGFRPHIFFDDQAKYCEPAAKVAPTARVPTA